MRSCGEIFFMIRTTPGRSKAAARYGKAPAAAGQQAMTAPPLKNSNPTTIGWSFLYFKVCECFQSSEE
jgi:hypothetical protein